MKKLHPYLRKSKPEPFTGKLGVPAKKIATPSGIYTPSNDQK